MTLCLLKKSSSSSRVFGSNGVAKIYQMGKTGAIVVRRDSAISCLIDAGEVFGTHSGRTICSLTKKKWAFERGLSFILFSGWNPFVKEVIFWSEKPQLQATRIALTLIYDRLIEIECHKIVVRGNPQR